MEHCQWSVNLNYDVGNYNTDILKSNLSDWQ